MHGRLLCTGESDKQELYGGIFMPELSVQLFRKLSVYSCNEQLPGFDSRKVQELLGYLLLYHDRPHPREKLASLLWGDSPTAQAKKSLRHTLWQLQTAINPVQNGDCPGFLQVELEWVQLNCSPDLWVDALVFEQQYESVRNVHGESLEPQHIQGLQSAVDLYTGDLLEGCYQEWCLYERERFQSMFLTILDKLVAYCEAQRNYADGLIYGQRILRYDRARESTHRQMMRLYYFAGDRTMALRQYERCAAALSEELDVDPADLTMTLYQAIRTDELVQKAVVWGNQGTDLMAQPTITMLSQAVTQLNELQALLGAMQRQLQQQAQPSMPNSSFPERSPNLPKRFWE
jgi:DNA-binding SARP family transcriptional activator